MSTMETDREGIDALRADGGMVRIRPVAPGDAADLRALHSRASDRSTYLRFFSLSRAVAADYVEHVIRPAGRDHQALVACVRGEIVGVAAFERIADSSAEFALLVADDRHHEGIGTLLLEHLASVARHAGITTFVGEVLAENAAMIKVLRDLGYGTRVTTEYGTIRFEVDLAPSDRVVTALADREREADAASLRPLLDPRTVAVVGASPRPGSVGNQVLCNILEAGFTGDVYAVNPKHSSVLGVPCVATPAELPVAADLAVIAVPAERVPDAIRACGERGVRSILLLSAGFGEAGPEGHARQAEALSVAREFGMRMVGPNCVGVVNTDPAVRLDATFAVLPMLPGTLGLMSQSGAFGIAFIDAAARYGVGISQFVSVGNKADVSGNDLLLAWDRDARTKVIGMYLESIGDARRFVRIARHIAAHKPILAMKSGRTSAGKRAGASHTAAAASSDVAIDAMFTEAGVVRVTSMQEMVDAALVLTDQPLPAGPRVAIIGNSGGPGILAADAVEDAGLDVVELDTATQELIRRAVPSAASTQNPIDLGAAVTPTEVAGALRVLLAATDVDAVLTVFTEVAVVDADGTLAQIVEAATTSGKPIIATQVGAPARSIALPDAARSLPVFTFPEPAAAALGVAYKYSRIRAEVAEPATPAADADARTARAIVESARNAGSEWLQPDEVTGLLRSYGVEVCPQRTVRGADAAAHAARELGYPVVLKVISPSIVHKSDVGGVRLGITDEVELRRAVDEIAAAVSEPHELLVQPMVGTGTELIVGAVRDPSVGPMVMLGAGGVLADLITDRAFRLAPVTEAHADDMIRGLAVARLLDGFRGRPVVARSAVRDVLVRVAALAHDLPEIAELDLNPVVCRGSRATVVDARIRLSAPVASRDPLARQMRASVPTTKGRTP